MGGNVIGIAKKLGLLLLMVALVALSLPGHIVLASGTTVEVNSGNTIVLNVEKNPNQSNIPLDVRGIVVSGNATGLAAFDFTLSWDAAVIRVDTVKATNDALGLGWAFTIGNINNTTGTVNFVGTTTQTPYSKADLTLAYLDITAVGSLGKKTSITVTIADLVDNKLQQITPRSAVNAPVEISLGALDVVVGSPAKTEPGVTNVSGSTNETGVSAEESATKSEPGVTNASGSVNETGVSAEKSTAKSEDIKLKPASEGEKVKPASAEGTTTVQSPPPKPINWGLIAGIIAGVVAIGVVLWLALRRRIV